MTKYRGDDTPLTVPVFDATALGTIQVGPTQVPLTTVSVPCYQLLVISHPDNDQYIYVGDETHGCHIPLVPGASMTIPIDNVSKIHVRAASGSQLAAWMAMV